MISNKHPRFVSLRTREKIKKGFDQGIVSFNGIIAQGRGEAFDYLLGEKTNRFAQQAIVATAAQLLLAQLPVLSINGNTSTLCAKDFIRLSQILRCPIEINLFHRTKKRELCIQNHLLRLGAQNVLSTYETNIKEVVRIQSERRWVHAKGIYQADVVLTALEDGDKCEVLKRLGKVVIAIDLNPFSRTAQNASVSIVDNVIRALPEIIKHASLLKKEKPQQLEKIVERYDNTLQLRHAERLIRKNIL